MALDYEVKHAIPGRLRVRVPALARLNGLCRFIPAIFSNQEQVHSVRVNPACASIVIEYDPGSTDLLPRLRALLAALNPADLRRLLEAAARSNTPAPANGGQNGAKSAQPQTTGLGVWRQMVLPTVSLGTALISGAASWLVALPLIVYNALPSFRRAYRVLAGEHRLNVDFLDSLAISISTLQGQFLTSAFMCWLIQLGDTIRDQTAARSRRVISELLDYQGRKAWVLRGEERVQVPVASIGVGETVIAYPGSLIPVDGEVLRGQAAVDQKTITGESIPVSRRPGDSVYAATVVREGKIYLRATRVGAQTTAAQIVQLVEAAPLGDTRVQNYAEKFADRLVAPALGLATLLYLLSGNLDRLLSMVIIDYGTGIRVAAPTSVLSCLISAARRGVVIKGGATMEKLARADTVVFDKTGTITMGAPVVRDVIPFSRAEFSGRRILGMAAAAEARHRHPVAEAIVAKAEEEGVAIPARDNSRYYIGEGVEAKVEGTLIQIGSERFMREKSVSLAKAAAGMREWNRRGESVLLVAADGELVGMMPYSDRIRPESAPVIEALHRQGLRTLLVSGDNSTVTGAVAARLGIDEWFSETLPADKAALVRKLQDVGRVVVMVGDGINDSPALSCADVGIAVKNGADVAQETAEVVLLSEGLGKLLTTLDIAKQAISLIHQNYALIAALNTFAMILAIPGRLISPGMIAAISNGSAILASLNAMRPVLGFDIAPSAGKAEELSERLLLPEAA